jgi:hypothetical protein
VSRRARAADPAREATVERLRATVPANATRAAEAIAGAVQRLGVVELIRAAVLVSDLAALADEDEDTVTSTGDQRGDTTPVSPADCAPSGAEP